MPWFNCYYVLIILLGTIPPLKIRRPPPGSSLVLNQCLSKHFEKVTIFRMGITRLSVKLSPGVTVCSNILHKHYAEHFSNVAVPPRLKSNRLADEIVTLNGFECYQLFTVITYCLDSAARSRLPDAAEINIL